MGSVSAPLDPPDTNSADESKHQHGNGGGVGTEPLVVNYEQVNPERAAPTVQDPTSSPPVNTSSYQPLGSHPPHPPSDDEEDTAPPPPDFTRRSIHIPMRTSSNTATITNKGRKVLRSSSVPTRSMPGTSDSGSQHARSDADSVMSYETTASTVQTVYLPALQQKGLTDDVERLSPLLEDDPRSFDLVAPNESEHKGFSLESRAELIMSEAHLEAIFNDTPSLLKFTAFLSTARPKSIPILIYYLDALKAIRAVNYANAVAEALDPIEGLEFTETPARPTINAVLEDKARQAFDILVREDLPAFVAQIFIQVVSVSVQKRVTGTLPPMLREASEGLAEVFCLSDPSRSDNPIIFASEEFHRTTQYGVNYAIGRNCRFLQGPRTNRNSVARLKKAVTEGKEVSEVFLNYRRDGSPFMNLLLMAPLLDSRGNMRYFIGAQVDVSGLVKDCSELEALQRLLAVQDGRAPEEEPKDEFQELGEMFNNSELDTVRRYGGNMHKEHVEDQDDAMSMREHRPRVLIKDMSNFDGEKAAVEGAQVRAEGRLAGVYKDYLLIRPAPSLRILFVSPSLRVPGILQSRFLDRIGGSNRVRGSLAEALADGSRGVTAKIRWLSSAAANLDADRVEEGRPRWIHCTPLLGQSGAVGVWMIILVDDEKTSAPFRRFRPAPPVANDLRRAQKAGSVDAFAAPDSTSDYDFDTRSLRQQPLQNGHYVPRHMVDLNALRRPQSSQDNRHDAQRAPQTQRSYSPAPHTGGNNAEPSSGDSSGCDDDSKSLAVLSSPDLQSNGSGGACSDRGMSASHENSNGLLKTADMSWNKVGGDGTRGASKNTVEPSSSALRAEVLADVENIRRLLGHQ